MPPADSDFYLNQLAFRRAPAIAQAAELINLGQYDKAISIARQTEDSIYTDVDLAKLFTEHLRQLAAKQSTLDKATLKRAFDYALNIHYRAYPEPHTQIEADRNQEGCAQDLAKLVRILGYRPE